MIWEIMSDLNGIGGYHGLGGKSRSTARAVWASSLGKGRWKASDGEVYETAAMEVLSELLVGLLCVSVYPALLELSDDNEISVQVPCKTEFHRTLIRKLIIKALLPEVELDWGVLGNFPIEVKGSVEDWVRLSIRLDVEGE
jgi:hypothetical protein